MRSRACAEIYMFRCAVSMSPVVSVTTPIPPIGSHAAQGLKRSRMPDQADDRNGHR